MSKASEWFRKKAQDMLGDTRAGDYKSNVPKAEAEETSKEKDYEKADKKVMDDHKKEFHSQPPPKEIKETTDEYIARRQKEEQAKRWWQK